MDWEELNGLSGSPEPEGRLVGPGDFKANRGMRPYLFYLSLVFLAFLLALGSLAIHRAIPIHQAILVLKPAAQGPGEKTNMGILPNRQNR